VVIVDQRQGRLLRLQARPGFGGLAGLFGSPGLGVAGLGFSLGSLGCGFDLCCGFGLDGPACPGNGPVEDADIVQTEAFGFDLLDSVVFKLGQCGEVVDRDLQRVGLRFALGFRPLGALIRRLLVLRRPVVAFRLWIGRLLRVRVVRQRWRSAPARLRCWCRAVAILLLIPAKLWRSGSVFKSIGAARP
jgi:hypothetical protein